MRGKREGGILRPDLNDAKEVFGKENREEGQGKLSGW